MIMFKSLLIVISLAYLVMARPQDDRDFQPEPYEYNYEVKDPEQNLFFDKNEAGDQNGRVTGKYSVLLPDGRLMTVEYTVDGESGFVPKISFQDNANPF